MADFSFIDKRGSRSSPLITRNLNEEMSRLKAAGVSLSKNQTHAKFQAKNAIDQVNNRTLMADMNRFNAGRRTASNTQLALPEVKEPGSSLIDLGVPLDVSDPEEYDRLIQWCRLYYATHHLIPLIIDIYSTFPLAGIEITSKDPLIQSFYQDMFFDSLNYDEFLPQMAQEYYVSGECTTLAHFDERLGIFSSEEILNPTQLMISRSHFVERDRIQLKVKDIVDALRSGPGGKVDPNETESQRIERQYQLDELTRFFPEFIEAAAREDGLDLSDALTSRIVHKASPWDLRGTPFMMRSFRSLLMEESLAQSQMAVADRLLSPLILAKVGSPDLGDGLPWIPDPDELDAVRNDMQAALAAKFRLVVSNFGLEVESVFGREAIPRFNDEYAQIEEQIMRTWGIGDALISGGSGTYASSALNREYASNLMEQLQKSIKRHIMKRFEVIAEAQEHYDYDLKGGQRIPKYREIVQYNEKTGEEEIVRVPKLIDIDVKFTTINLRDDATERTFYQTLKSNGVPVSDRTLAVNLEMDWDEELDAVSEETVAKQLAQAKTMQKIKEECDLQGWPYPAQLAQYLEQTLTLRQQMAQTTQAEAQGKLVEQQSKQMMPAGQLGLLPGTVAQPPSQPQAKPGQGGQQGGGQQKQNPMEQGSKPQDGKPQTPPAAAGSPGFAQPGMGGPKGKPQAPGLPTSAAPSAFPPNTPGLVPPKQPGKKQEIPRNRTRPAESDEMRAGAPRAATLRKMKSMKDGPSSYGHRFTISEDQTQQAVNRLSVVSDHIPTHKVAALVEDSNFYTATNSSQYEAQIRADFSDIVAGSARVKESAKLLREALEQYEYIYGITPEWD